MKYKKKWLPHLSETAFVVYGVEEDSEWRDANVIISLGDGQTSYYDCINVGQRKKAAKDLKDLGETFLEIANKIGE